MLHPIMIGIVALNTSITIIYWAFILIEAFHKKVEDEPKKDNPA